MVDNTIELFRYEQRVVCDTQKNTFWGERAGRINSWKSAIPFCPSQMEADRCGTLSYVFQTQVHLVIPNACNGQLQSN